MRIVLQIFWALKLVLRIEQVGGLSVTLIGEDLRLANGSSRAVLHANGSVAVAAVVDPQLRLMVDGSVIEEWAPLRPLNLSAFVPTAPRAPQPGDRRAQTGAISALVFTLPAVNASGYKAVLLTNLAPPGSVNRTRSLLRRDLIFYYDPSRESCLKPGRWFRISDETCHVSLRCNHCGFAQASEPVSVSLRIV